MGTITVLDSTGSTQTVAKVANTGSAADSASLPVTQSTEDKALVTAANASLASIDGKLVASPATSTLQTSGNTLTGAVTETAPASDTASSGLNGRLQRIAQRLTSLIAQIPAALGATTKAASLSVALATDAVGKLIAGAKTSLTVTGLGTLASATYVASAVKNNTTNQPLDVVVEVTVASTNSVAGLKQVSVFAKASFDNSVFQSGPESGTTTTDEPNLTFLGTVPVNSSSTDEVRSFSVAAAYAGMLPPYFKIVLKNETGVALTSASVSTIEFSYKVAA